MLNMLRLALALPREARQSNGFNGLRNFLGKKRLVVFQGVLEGPPKLGRGEALIHCKRARAKIAHLIETCPGSRATFALVAGLRCRAQVQIGEANTRSLRNGAQNAKARRRWIACSTWTTCFSELLVGRQKRSVGLQTILAFATHDTPRR
jgi:hypothetical protein